MEQKRTQFSLPFSTTQNQTLTIDVKLRKRNVTIGPPHISFNKNGQNIFLLAKTPGCFRKQQPLLKKVRKGAARFGER